MAVQSKHIRRSVGARSVCEDGMKAIDINSLTLSAGSHRSAEEGMCIMEAVSYVAGKPFSDSPQCACPVLAAFARYWNDGLRSNQERDQLKQYIPRLLETKASKAVEQLRALMAADWLIRVYSPTWLDLVPALTMHASALRAHPEIVDTAGLISVLPIAVAARKAAWAAARAAARDADWAAARDAAGDADWAAARDAAGAAAGAAAWAALTPTVTALQSSAHDLYSRMIDAREDYGYPIVRCPGQQYRNLAYVQSECAALAQQLKAMGATS